MANSCSSKALLALAAAALSGCAGAGAQLPTLSLPSVPSVEAASQQTTTSVPHSAPGTPQQTGNVIDQTGGQGGSATDIYSRIATGAMKCWFTVGGPLKADYVYHANAAPPSRGGKAQIIIHRRDPTQPNPRGAKAYQVDIEPTGEASATVKTENLKMTDAFGGAMTSDIKRWTNGEEGCASSAVAGWIPTAPQPATEAAAGTKAKTVKKTKATHKAKGTPTQANAPAKSQLKSSAND
jgi:hypothetical protein